MEHIEHAGADDDFSWARPRCDAFVLRRARMEAGRQTDCDRSDKLTFQEISLLKRHLIVPMFLIRCQSSALSRLAIVAGWDTRSSSFATNCGVAELPRHLDPPISLEINPRVDDNR